VTTNKISACLIVRDEQGTIEACLASIRQYVDEIVIVDTGSTDDTPAIARKIADKFEVFLDCNDAEGRIDDFSLARNRSFAIASNDVVLWLDGDDVLQGAEHLPLIAAELVKYPNSQVILPYEYAHDEQGRVTLLQYRERMLYPRKHWEWRFPVHESCLLTAGHELSVATRDESVRLVHGSGSGKTRETERNLRILRKYIERVGEEDVRSLYYYGVELGLQAMRGYGRGDIGAFLENTGASLRVLKRYVELAYWADEKFLALLEIARHYQRLNDHDEAIRWAFRASETKHFPEAYWVLMRSYYSIGRQDKRSERLNYERAVHFGQIGMSLVPTDVAQSLLAQDPTERARAHEVLAVCQGSIGHLDDAIGSLEAGLRVMPEHELMKKNLKAFHIERAKRRVLAETSVLQQAGALAAGADAVIRMALSDDFSVQLQPPTPHVPDAAPGRVLPFRSNGAGVSGGTDGHPRAARSPGKLDIIFFVGPGFEPWNGETIARTGLGGSETMAWELARRLAKRGHGVRLIGHVGPGAPAGTFDGVEFIGCDEFFSGDYGGRPGARHCDVLISSRQPGVVDDGAGITAGARILWLHDVHCGPQLTHKRNIRFDRILALSNWHKSFLRRCYPLIDPEKILVTRNGIDLTRYDGRETRNARRAFYSSSPDRGLDVLLDVWPVVRKSIPDAELHVFYGFENWERSADDNERKKIAHLKAKLARTAGVRVRGRVNGEELAREQLRCGVWTFSTAFTETSCLTGMEAQAAGCRIVTSPLAALNETVGDRGQLVPGFGTPGYIETFAAAVVMAMTETLGARAVDDRAALQEYARKHFGLEELASEWETMLLDILNDVRRRVVPKFYKAVVV